MNGKYSTSDGNLDITSVRARGVGNAVFIEHIGGNGDIAAIGVGTKEFAADLAGELNAIFNGFRAALADAAAERWQVMRETTESKPEPAQPQRWWVDYLHTVQSGRLVDAASGKAVVSNHAGFHIIDLDQLKTNYHDACAEAMTRLGKAQQDITNKLASLMASMAKNAGGAS